MKQTRKCQLCGRRDDVSSMVGARDSYDRMNPHGKGGRVLFEHRSCRSYKLELERRDFQQRQRERLLQSQAAQDQATAEGFEPESLSWALRASQIFEAAS